GAPALQLGDGTTGGSILGDVAFEALGSGFPGVLIFDQPADSGFGGVISGPGSVDVTGGHTLSLTGHSDYTGGTTVETDTNLSISADDNIGAVTVNTPPTPNGGLLSLEGNNTLFLTASFTLTHDVMLAGTQGFDVGNGLTVTITGLMENCESEGSLNVIGAGTLVLDHVDNTYGDPDPSLGLGTFLIAGTLEVAALGAAGPGVITFETGDQTLRIDDAGLSSRPSQPVGGSPATSVSGGASFGNPIDSFGFGDVLDLPGLQFVTGATASYDDSSQTLTVTSNGVTDTFTLTNPAGTHFLAIPEPGPNTGTEVVLDQLTLTGLGPSVTFLENTVNAAPQIIDNSVTFTNTPGDSFDGGTLVVKGGFAEDFVSIHDQGPGPGQIGFDFDTGDVSFGGTVIGTSDFGGSGGSPLTVTFNADATPDAIQALIENLTFFDGSD